MVAYVLDVQGKIWDSSGCSLKYKSLVVLPCVLSSLKQLDRAGVYWVGLCVADCEKWVLRSGYVSFFTTCYAVKVDGETDFFD